MYCEHIDNETKQIFGLTVKQYDGYIEVNDIEQAYNGSYYVKGYCPEKPQEIKEQEIRQVRNEYLTETDKFVSIPDFPIDFDTKDLYIEYRQYLRDYTKLENWWKQNPKTFEDWRKEC